MTLYTRDDFDKSLLPKHLKRDSYELIDAAIAVGWKFHLNSSQGCSIIAPGNPSPKSYHFGKSGRSTISHNRIRKDVIRFGDPDLLLQVLATPALTEAGVEMGPLRTLGDPDTFVDNRPKEEPVSSEPEVQQVYDIPAPHIVQTLPMIAKRSKHTGYESHTTMERTWSDGSKDYICTKCNYTNTNRVSVSRHYGTLHAEGKAAQPETFKAEVPEAAQYAPRQTRIDALAEVLKQMLHDSPTGMFDIDDLPDIAKEALTWVHAQSRENTPLAVEHEEMSAEDTLHRIRLMLDQGQYVRLQEENRKREQEMTELRERLSEMDTQMALVQGDVEHYLARAEEAEGTLRSFRDLIAETVSDRKAM